MVILGIDPGVAIVGFGVLDAHPGRTPGVLACGAINTPAGLRLSARLLQIETDLAALIARFSPEAMAVEELFFSKNVTTGIAVAHARGVILLTAEKQGVPIHEYKPMQIKQAVTGYGGAHKLQVMKMTQRLLSLKELPRPDDAADALAVALCHARSATSLLNRSKKDG